MARILLLVDVSNLYYCVYNNFYKRKVSYQTLLRQVVQADSLVAAIAYGSELDNNSAQFKVALRDLGYTLKYKEPSRFPNGAKEHRKADWDVGMAVDAIDMADQADVIVFATADGDLAPCVTYLRGKGKEVRVIGSKISSQLKATANSYVEIDESYLL